MKGELLENRIVVWDIQESRNLFASGYFGKPIGIPQPNVDEINVPLILDLIEGCYPVSYTHLTLPTTPYV